MNIFLDKDKIDITDQCKIIKNKLTLPDNIGSQNIRFEYQYQKPNAIQSIYYKIIEFFKNVFKKPITDDELFRDY